MLTMFSDADFRWSNGFSIRCIHVNLLQFFQIQLKLNAKIILFLSFGLYYLFSHNYLAVYYLLLSNICYIDPL